MDYSKLLFSFVERLTSDQQKAAEAKGNAGFNGIHATFVTGRKFDKIRIKPALGAPETRFFVDKKDGTIYGAKSKNAPNLKWYFGTLETFHLWEWGDYHPSPVNDPSVRAVKRYGPFITYVKV